MAEILSIAETIVRGSKQKKVINTIQEWLCLNGQSTKIDGDYGPATEVAVSNFQKNTGLIQTGNVDPLTFEKLVSPMKSLSQTTLSGNGGLLPAVVELSLKYLEAHPMEVGGQNMGPWVRYFMDGYQGNAWPWCAGFNTFIVKQAAKLCALPTALPRTYSCDILGMWAKNNGKFISGTSGNLSAVKPGHLFLVRKSQNDWQHTGIVIEMTPEYCVTIEGNTNDEGSREGYEVCKRSRGFKTLDFVVY
jgi:peptidoglycan hydrolase-like protein with peptidoglycan-binding domain